MKICLAGYWPVRYFFTHPPPYLISLAFMTFVEDGN